MSSLCALAQTAGGFGPALTATSQIPSNYVRVAPLSPMVVCAWPPTGGTPCTNKITTYTDPSASVSCPLSAQVLSPGTTACQTTSDVFGNFTFFTAAPSSVAYYFKVGNAWSGPFVVSIGGGTGVSTGTTGHLGLYTSGTSLGSDANIDDGITTPSTITSTETVAMPQLNLTGTGGFEVTSPGAALSAAGAGNGGIGIATNGIPQINPNNAGWFAIPYITVNGTALANTANNTDLSSSTPAAPANGLNLAFQFSGQHISAAIVGDGNAAHCFLGTGVFGACAGGGGSVTLDNILAAAGSHTIANGNFGQIWQWALSGATAVGITDTESAAATGGTPLSQAIRQVATIAGSTAVPLILSDSLTGSQTLPAGYIKCTWNTTGIVDACLLINVTNTASGASSLIADFQVGATSEFEVDKNGNVYANNSYGGTGPGTSMNFCAGQAACGSNSTNGQVGSAQFQGADNNNAGASTKAGATILRGGMLTAATPNAAALEGLLNLGIGGVKGSVIANVGDVLTASAQDVYTDCPLGCTAIVGIASNTGSDVGVIMYGTALVKLDGALAAVNDHICGPPSSTGTIGLAHDNGGTVCPSGQNIGIAVGNSGTVVQMSGSGQASTAMSTTLVKVALHIGD